MASNPRPQAQPLLLSEFMRVELDIADTMLTIGERKKSEGKEFGQERESCGAACNTVENLLHRYRDSISPTEFAESEQRG
jgi:hypothetical protein